MEKKKGKQQQVFLAHIKTKDFYKYYRTNYMKNKGKLIPKSNKYYIDYSLYISILDAFNLLFKEDLLYKAKEVMFPLRTGSLVIKKKKRINYIDKNNKVVLTNPINWKATNDLWASDEDAKQKKILIRHTNPHSKGMVAEVIFSRNNCKVKNRNRYSFITCRTFKLNIKDIMIDEDSPIDFLEAK